MFFIFVQFIPQSQVSFQLSFIVIIAILIRVSFIISLESPNLIKLNNYNMNFISVLITYLINIQIMSS